MTPDATTPPDSPHGSQTPRAGNPGAAGPAPHTAGATLPQVHLTVPEIEALCLKAARGAGHPWGVAEEAAWAAGWLASHGLPGAELVLDWCESGARNGPVPAARAGAPGVVPLCPVRLGAALADFAGLTPGAPPWQGWDTAQPMPGMAQTPRPAAARAAAPTPARTPGPAPGIRRGARPAPDPGPESPGEPGLDPAADRAGDRARDQAGDPWLDPAGAQARDPGGDPGPRPESHRKPEPPQGPEFGPEPDMPPAAAPALALGPMAAPGLLLPFMMRAAQLSARVLRLEQGAGIAVTTTPDGGCTGRIDALMAAPPFASVVLSAPPPGAGTAPPAPLARGAPPALPRDRLARLEALGQATLVPASARSRSDAGARIHDND